MEKKTQNAKQQNASGLERFAFDGRAPASGSVTPRRLWALIPTVAGFRDGESLARRRKAREKSSPSSDRAAPQPSDLSQ